MSLTEALVEEANIELAWKNLKANRGAPGPDGITITEFPTWFRPRWNANRPFDPTSHRTNPDSCVRSGFLGLELWVSTESDPTRQESQRTLAYGQDDCKWCRDDE
jgi:hypothetical protein